MYLNQHTWKLIRYSALEVIFSLDLLSKVCLQVSLRLEGDIALNTSVFIQHFHRLATILIA